MDKLILNEFYNKILPSIRDNNVTIDGFKFNIEFQTIIGDNKKYTNGSNSETLFIKDVDLFNKLLITYTEKMFNIIVNSNLKSVDYVYYNGNKRYIIDFVLSNLWSNVTDTDLLDPINYLVNRINFLSDPFYDYESKVIYLQNLDILNNSDIEYSIQLNKPVYETPYSFCSYITRDKDEGEVFELPKVYYGISNNQCYIYSVQGSSKFKKNEYTKKINRLLYKVNKDISDEYELDNILDVTPSALVSLTLFIKLLKENNIDKINVIDYMPIRYKAKDYSITKKLDKLKSKSSPEEFAKIELNYRKQQENIQKNIVDKFLRNFRRLEKQLGDIHITSFPKDVDSNMHINIMGEAIDNDNILNKLYNYEEKKKTY